MNEIWTLQVYRLWRSLNFEIRPVNWNNWERSPWRWGKEGRKHSAQSRNSYQTPDIDSWVDCRCCGTIMCIIMNAVSIYHTINANLRIQFDRRNKSTKAGSREHSQSMAIRGWLSLGGRGWNNTDGRCIVANSHLRRYRFETIYTPALFLFLIYVLFSYL